MVALHSVKYIDFVVATRGGSKMHRVVRTWLILFSGICQGNRWDEHRR